jgi:hypothetical protein
MRTLLTVALIPAFALCIAGCEKKPADATIEEKPVAVAPAKPAEAVAAIPAADAAAAAPAAAADAAAAAQPAAADAAAAAKPAAEGTK